MSRRGNKRWHDDRIPPYSAGSLRAVLARLRYLGGRCYPSRPAAPVGVSDAQVSAELFELCVGYDPARI